MNKLTFLFFCGALTSALILAARPAGAQTNIPWNVAEGSWSNADNWNHPDGAFLPNAAFDEVAVIGNGGLAFVEDTPADSPGGVTINSGSTLEIRAGGMLTLVPGPAPPLVTGAAAVNNGNLVGLSGGTLTAESLTSGGAGTIDLMGNTNLTINGNSTLGGVTRITGPDVNFSTAGLGTTGTIEAVITGPTHAAIDVGGAATLSGALAVNFNGPNPSFGDTWDIIDAQSITGDFANVTTSAALGPGLVMAAQIVNGGNGQIAQAVVDTRLTLELNRRTGATHIKNLAGLQANTIDGYLISSPGGTFDANEWIPSGLPNWVPSTGSATHVGETSLLGNREIGASDDINLGNIFANPARSSEFGVAVEDALFQYHLEGGETLTGLIEYTDAHNNMVLVVDPDTGDTWMQNQSLFDVTIDGYEIESLSGALAPSMWTSFADGDAAWTEANPAANHIGELNLNSSTTLGGEGNALSLGQIFTPGSEQDLLFTFHVTPNGVDGVGDDPAGVTLVGIVEYDQGPIDFGGGIAGDYNGDGVVNAADYSVWRNGDSPDSSSAGYDLWKANFGRTAAVGSASSAAVPEPCTLVLAGLTLACAASLRRRGG